MKRYVDGHMEMRTKYENYLNSEAGKLPVELR